MRGKILTCGEKMTPAIRFGGTPTGQLESTGGKPSEERTNHETQKDHHCKGSSLDH